MKPCSRKLFLDSEEEYYCVQEDRPCPVEHYSDKRNAGTRREAEEILGRASGILLASSENFENNTSLSSRSAPGQSSFFSFKREEQRIKRSE